MTNLVVLDSWVVIITAVIIPTLSIILWKFLFNNSCNNKTSCSSSPPGPWGLPVVGYIPFLRIDRLHRQFTDLADRYGPIYKIRIGNIPFFVISSTPLIKEVVRDLDTIFANRFVTVALQIATYDLNGVAWAKYGSLWRDQRKILFRELISNSNIEASYNLRRDEVRKAVKEVHSRRGVPIHVSNTTFEIQLKIIVNMFYGGKIGPAKRQKIVARLLPALARVVDLFIKANISDIFPILARFDIQGIAKEMTDYIQRIDEVLEDCIDERMQIVNHVEESEVAAANKEGQTDFLQVLVDLMMQEDKQASFGRTQIKAMLIDVLLGATDTGASTIEWVMADLLSHPKEMKRVQEELDRVVGLKDVVEELHVPKLEYLDAVLKESMRLHPCAPLLPKRPSQDCNVGGYAIPKDSNVFVNFWSAHRDPLVWDDPSKFRPERFSENAEKWDFHGNNFNYLPFGSGRRFCVGYPLAEITVKYILASFLHEFEWSMPEGETLDMSEKFVSGVRKCVPLRVVAAPRFSHSTLYEWVHA